MSQKNERYYKRKSFGVQFVEQRGKYSNQKNILEKYKTSRSNVRFEAFQGQVVTMKEKTPSLKKMPKKQFPTLKKLTRKEKLANIRIRLIVLKCAYKWEKCTFGKVIPSKARQHYKQKLLKKSFQQWEDMWWNGRNEWKLNIRADYHNRFRMWLKVWKGWRSFLVLQKIKKTKMDYAIQKANSVLLKKSLASWKCYIGERHRKKQFFVQAEEEGKTILKRMAFSKWKNFYKLRQDQHAMEDLALHFWAQNLLHKAWRCWIFRYSTVVEETHKLAFAGKLYNRRLELKALRSFKIYAMQRKLKKLRLLSGVRFYRLCLTRWAFLKWKITWKRKVELMQFEDTVQSKGEMAKKQRIFNHWKHYITLCRYKRQNELKASLHFQMKVKIKCMKALLNRVVVQRKTAMYDVTAKKFYKVSLLRRVWLSWLSKCESRDDLRHIISFNLAHEYFRKRLLSKSLKAWGLYCDWRKFGRDQYLKADVMARRNLLPRIFTQWEKFVDLVKTQRASQGKADGFRRECLLAKTFYSWLQEYHLALDVQMLYRMAIISYDEKVKREFFQRWLTRTRQRLRENSLLKRGQDHYRLQLKKKCLVSWRKYIVYLNYSSARLNLAVRHQNTKLLLICWSCWTKFATKRREKWKLVIKADLHFREGILRKIVQAWKVYCDGMKEIKSFVEEKKTTYDKQSLRSLFKLWRTNVWYSKISRHNDHMSSHHWKIRTTRRVFLAWRVYAEDRLWEKQQELYRISEFRKELDQGKLRCTLRHWKKAYESKISSKDKWKRAVEHWKTHMLRRAVDVLKKYRFLGYRKQVLRRQYMLYHNRRIIVSHWEIWKSKYNEHVILLKKSHMALWMWSFTLQQKAFVSWFRYAEEKRRKKIAVNNALARRQDWLHKVVVTQWIKFATYFMAERESFAASRHIQLSQSVQRTVQRCALHWRRITEKNRGKRRQVASMERSLFAESCTVSHNGNTSKRLSPTFKRDLPSIRRPQPRVPEYLRESFNLSELSEYTPCTAVSQPHEALPRNLPQPVTQPVRVLEPSGYASSMTSSNTSQTGHAEMRTVRSNSQGHPKKRSSREKYVLLPPSSFVQTKAPMHNVLRKQFSQERMESKVQGSHNECKSSSEQASIERSKTNLISDAIPGFLSDKNSQQSIVQLRNRMWKYYTVSTHFRELRSKLTALRQWSCDLTESNGGLSEEELSLINELVNELTDNVASTRKSLEQSYKTIVDDLEKLLERVS